MTCLRRFTFCVTLVTFITGVAHAQINGYKANPRVFNDNPGSLLTITPPAPINVNPATITIDEIFTGAFGGANRHDVMASGDGGLTAYNFNIDSSFIFSTRLTLTAGDNAPRKEAGIRINSPITGDMLFIVNSDAGEIVAFSGGAPFYRFGQNSDGNGYTPGTSILMGIKLAGGGDGSFGVPTTIEYFIDRGSGVVSSGPLAWSNLEGGPLNYQLGVYAQGGSDGGLVIGDYVNAVFSQTTFVVPEPGTLSLVSLGLFGVLALRRNRQA